MSETDAIVEELLRGLEEGARAATPAFVRTMPRAYFDDTTPAMRLAHLKAILAAEAGGGAQTVTVRDREGHHTTFIGNRSYPGQLSEFVRRLPRDLPLTSAQVYTSASGDRVIDIFHFGEHTPYDHADPEQRECVRAAREYAEAQDGAPGADAIERHLRSCDGSYLAKTPHAQVYRHLRMADRIRERGQVLTLLEPYHEPPLLRLTLGIADHDSRSLFERVSQFLGSLGIDIQRAHLDSFRDAGGEIALLTFLVRRDHEPLDPDGEAWSRIEFVLRRLPYLDATVFDLADRIDGCELPAAEVLIGLAHLVHQKLVDRDPLRFSRERIVAALERHPALARSVADLFGRRFEPSGDGGRSTAADLEATIERDTDADDTRTILATLVEAVLATLRTNVRLPDRQALAFRIDPDFLAADRRAERPFGVFFVSGSGFDAFHVRFRDIARGGVRIVRPAGAELYALETERHYDEAYGLALAQQQKNKDIPEGGSKGVILASPGADPGAVGRAFADALLDLILPDPRLHTLHADHYRRDELLYLGPDENIADTLIEWIVARARRRGHPMPGAFMSSKAGAGINHKQYGVTSEGVTVFLERALREAGIDPRARSFTVKMTGGPDGDVAGNQIRILDREFREHVRIVAIADGSGSAEDPDGLDRVELRRLVDASSPIAAFDPSRLGPRGRVVGVDRPGGIRLRNTLHERIVADAFIPAGGRPGTIHEGNWSNFLDADGRPSSRVIVEGANLFVTPPARARLSERGVIIIKDSSANKAGVICSSFEIVASMLLDEREFLALKPQFVAEVLDRLRALADLEARTLFREHRHKPDVHLPVLSERLSRAINRATDAIDAAIDTLRSRRGDLVRAVVIEHLPASLYAACGERVFDEVPRAYLDRIVASSLASRIVYREGLDWTDSMPGETIARLAERYLVEQAAVQDLMREVRGSDCPNRERIARLLEAGGVAASLRLDED